MTQLYSQQEKRHDKECIFHTFLTNHSATLQTHIMNTFLTPERYERLQKAVVKHDTKEQRLLNKEFHQFYSEVRLLHYINKLCSHYSRDVMRVKEKERSYIPLRLQQPAALDGNRTVEDMLGVQDGAVWEHEFLGNQLENRILHHAFRQLTAKQQCMLHLIIVERWTHKEIAAYFSISQQAVSNHYQRALSKLKKIMKVSDRYV